MLQHADQPEGAMIGIFKPCTCEQIDMQGDRSKCHQPKARSPHILTGATQTGGMTTRQVLSPCEVHRISLQVAGHLTRSYICIGVDEDAKALESQRKEIHV